MQQLSELDASFLYLESDTAPMHTGGIYVFKRNQSDFDFSSFVRLIKAKLSDAPFYRERIVQVPLKLDLPYWVDDPEFDLSKQLFHADLTNESQNLMEYGAQELSKMLPRDRPLWSVTFVEGLQGETDFTADHVALIVKIHIANIDGQTGDDIISRLLTISPEAAPIEPVEDLFRPTPLPSSFSLIGEAYGKALTLPLKLAYLAKGTASSVFYSLLFERLKKLNLGQTLKKVPATPLNRNVGSERVMLHHNIPVDKIRKIHKELIGVTTNDIVMGICAEALNQYLQEQGVSPASPLIALSSISVRSTSLDVRSGNQLAAMLFSLATDEPDAIRRIFKIHDEAVSSEVYQRAISASRLTEAHPTKVAALSSRVYCEFKLAQKFKPMFNIPITNIPGPQFPLYMQECELEQLIGFRPLFDGIGLALMIVSYNSNYSVTATYSPTKPGETWNLSGYLERALTIIEKGLETYSLENSDHQPQENLLEKGATLIEDVSNLVSGILTLRGKDNNGSGK